MEIFSMALVSLILVPIIFTVLFLIWKCIVLAWTEQDPLSLLLMVSGIIAIIGVYMIMGG